MAWDFYYKLYIGLDLALVVCILYWIKATLINLNGKKVKKTQLFNYLVMYSVFC